MDDGIRLNKYLASCGAGSRRSCDAMVQEGRVTLNGQPCSNPAVRVQPGDYVKLDGKTVSAKRVEVIALHKPRGLVCSKDDELGRETIFELLPGHLSHLNHVGRLDRDSEGLLILTNDGQLSQSLLHPSKQVEKEYLVTASRPVGNEHIEQFLRGIFTEEGRLAATEVERISPRRLRMVLVTGHKRQIRTMLRTLGYHVEKLLRIRIGSLVLGDLPLGKFRMLDPGEVEALGRNPKPARRRPAADPAKGRRGAAGKSAGKTFRKRAGDKRSGPPARDSGRSGRGRPPGKKQTRRRKF